MLPCILTPVHNVTRLKLNQYSYWTQHPSTSTHEKFYNSFRNFLIISKRKVLSIVISWSSGLRPAFQSRQIQVYLRTSRSENAARRVSVLCDVTPRWLLNSWLVTRTQGAMHAYHKTPIFVNTAVRTTETKNSKTHLFIRVQPAG